MGTQSLNGATTAVMLGLIFSAALASGQSIPDFSGTWEQVSSSDPAITDQQQTIAQTSTTLTVGHPSPRGGHQFVYRLDGSETRSTLMGTESVATVSIEGERLRIFRTDTYPDGRIQENRQLWYLDSIGRLIIESSTTPKGGAAITRTIVYKKRTLLRERNELNSLRSPFSLLLFHL